MNETKKISAQKAINNHCKGCAYDPQDKGNWREQVESCTIINCELYFHRPLTAKTKKKERDIWLAGLSEEQRENELKRGDHLRGLAK